MKYRKRSAIFSLLAGLTVLTNSCRENKSLLSLVATKDLNFPSTSALAFHNNRLYIFGDDARSVLVLNKDYQILDSIPYFNWPSVRISKEIKPDIESVILMDKEMLAFGSAATDKRNIIFHFPLAGNDSIYSERFFPPGWKIPSLAEMNIEGAFFMNDHYILANRANSSNRQNHLIYWNQIGSPRLVSFILPVTNKIAGVSDLCYVKAKDLLLFTVSEEDTPNALQDGVIGESYLGYVRQFSQKFGDSQLKADTLIPLIQLGKELKKQKIEAISPENTEGEEWVLHLAADNDKGGSRLFKIVMKYDDGLK